MAHMCPQCALENADHSIFCSRCGFRFPPVEEPGPLSDYASTPTPGADPPSPVQQGYAAQGPAPSPDAERPYVPSLLPYQAGAGAPLPQQGSSPFAPPAGPIYGGSMSDPYAAPGAIYGPTGPQQQQVPFPGPQAPQGQFPPPKSAKPRSAPSLNLAVVQRAFAGKGPPITHASWLVDGKQVTPTDVRSALVEKVQQRYPNEVKASQEHLSERDAVLEERDYVKIERAPASVFVYVTRFGPDLYIARTTTVQPALSPVRMVVLGGLLVLMLIGFIIAAAVNPSVLDIGGFLGAFQFKFIVSLFSSLLLIFFIGLALRSLLLWLTERDYLVYLRPNVLNDFRLDDGAILEHIADRSTREAAEGLGLDATELAGPPRTYPARQPLHRV